MTANTKYLGVVLIGLVTTAALATDRLVPQQYPSIQAAINASATGDRVVLAAGTYRETVSLLGRSVTIEGAAGQRPTDTVIVSPGGPAVVFSDSVSYSGVIGLRNLTIDGESVTRSGAGVISSYLGPDGSLIFERCVFRNWHSSQTDGGAMFIAHPRTVVRQCAFSGNWSSVHGAAIYAYDGVQAVIEHCSFDGHTFGTGTFYARTNASLTVRECVVRNSNALTAHWQTGTVSYFRNRGCAIGTLSNGGFIDGGGNDWNSCPDCDGDGVLDIEEAVVSSDGCADCNGDHIADYIQLANGSLLDQNFDGKPDVCEIVINGVIPVSGPSTGGTSVSISGSGFQAGASVLVGGNPAHSVDVVSPTKIIAVTPPGMPGMTSITISGMTQSNTFYYRPECGSDLDQNGVVDGGDMAILLLDWGPCVNSAAASGEEPPALLRQESSRR